MSFDCRRARLTRAAAGPQSSWFASVVDKAVNIVPSQLPCASAYLPTRPVKKALAVVLIPVASENAVVPVVLTGTARIVNCGVSGNPAFQLPTFSVAIMNPISMSVRRDIPRHMTMLPGGPSPARFK